MCGIFGYCSFLKEKSRKEVLEVLCAGLARQEYRGYDSAGLCVDGDSPGKVVYFKEVGKVAGLRKKIAASSLDVEKTCINQVSIAHTRWATHGPPSERNCHPIRSDPESDFVVVHNGIVTNSAELRLVLQKRGYKFETETDTEAVAILTKYVFDSHQDKELTFTGLIKAVLKELEGSFAFVFKSRHFPNEVVTARRGSPLLIGVKTDKKLKVDFVDVEFAGQDNSENANLQPSSAGSLLGVPSANPKVLRTQSRAFMSEDGLPQPIEFFIASDAAAIVEHTKRVLYLEDDDIAHIAEGELHIHRIRRKEGDQTPSQIAATRTIETLELEIAAIMKGKFDTFMQKEIYEQPESVVNTMLGVASTKAYTSQYVALLMIALQLSEDRISFMERRNQIIAGLHALPGQIKKVLELDAPLQQLAATVSENKSLLLMGRGYQRVFICCSFLLSLTFDYPFFRLSSFTAFAKISLSS
ncbi:N-terminal nucleophile aminohydrolase [Agrocybe pediades]|nr:N-terminal nucleophile aminohydrolase [Agrocybe pediades]